ncbi:glycolate oxidase subunit GlcE [Methyloferula stellata]|uniref:glycolate oxidase subunit GlcE n=1 Tax=Methyloferula stellata TaxID=876270 RepID=UPI00035F8B8A|nr:glycolate oxidase subunit GlcE [Methyloferula stellata]
MAIFSPASEVEVREAVIAARTNRRPFAIRGGGTRSSLGRPAEAEDILSTERLRGITLYEPAELVISARAGTPLAEVEAQLDAHRQRLPFEPMDHRQLLGSTGEPSIGAIAACNLSGPRRIQLGAARDFLIGLKLVNGRGESIKGGGRVTKNVTGLDMVKLNGGAHGTLGVLTEVTFKVLPATEESGTLVLVGLDDTRAIAALSAALTSPFQPTGAAHLPAGLAGDRALTLIRIEGFASAVSYRLEAMRTLLASYTAGEFFDKERTAQLWRDIRDCAFLAEPRDRAVWRISVAPAEGAKVADAIKSQLDMRYFYDWGGGLLWLSVNAAGDAGALAIRQAVAKFGGHATLVRAPAETRAATSVFQPLAEPLMKITAGIKASFDPDHLINPGLMYAGI